MEKISKVYQYVDGINDLPFPNKDNQLEIGEFTYDAKRMGGAPTISASVKHPTCLDDNWTGKKYVDFRGEKYVIKQTPSSSYSNEDNRYKHDLAFVSERIILDNTYFYDVVTDPTDVDKYVSNSSKVIFFGDIHEFAKRLDYSLKYSKVGYTVVVDEGILTESFMMSFEDQFFSQVLQSIFEVYGIPYYFVGKVIHIGYTNNAITRTFKYGVDDALLSISKTNANYKIVNRITGSGSSDNIPYYYPNPSDDRSAIEEAGGKWVTPSDKLMPPIYGESGGSERFYNAKDNTYINPENGKYYVFENEYTDGNPKEHKVSFDHIKPTIKEMVNAAGLRMDMFESFGYDYDDNDETDEEGKYIHPYFFGKLRKFDGVNGFNLFDHAIDEGEMTISMTSGSCGSCNFVIAVDDETKMNPVRVHANGELLRDENGNVDIKGKPQDVQQNTQINSVWIALKKDTESFGVIMPNAASNYKPTAKLDTFSILHIDLPQAYITSAENKLKEEIIKYMATNNSDKFNFSINFSRIFFAENPDILALLNENARLQIEYNKKIYELYISSYSYKMNSNDPLPQITVELSDTLTINKGTLQTSIDSVKQDILGNIGGNVDFLKQGLKYFVRKDIRDYAKFVSFRDGIDVGSFESLLSGGTFRKDVDGKSYIEVDRLYVRLKAIFENLEIKRTTYVGGEQIASPASMKCIKVEDREIVIDPETKEETIIVWDYYRCYYLKEQEGVKIQNEFKIGDQAICKEANLASGSNVSNQYYWRLVVGVGDGYIDLSKVDCDTGSTIPTSGDDIVQLGHRSDATRQKAIIQSTVSIDAPSIKLLAGINSFSLEGKAIISQGFDSSTGKAKFSVYGETYIGNPDGSSFIRYTPDKGVEINATLSIGTKFGDEGNSLLDALNKATNDAVKESSNQLSDYAAQVTKDIEGLKDQIDGAIETWFFDPIPTLTNKPAVDWTTAALKNLHLGDLYYSAEGKAYRFQLDGTSYIWKVLSDSDIAKALADAKKAQDTADGKRKVFVRQPLNAEDYAVGDLWVNASFSTIYKNDLLRCKTAKAINASFNIIHWELASKYTDDTIALEAAKAAAAAQKSADEAKAASDTVADSVSDLNTYVDGAFKDGVITETEAQTISNYINIVNNNKVSADNLYSKLYANIYLYGTAKSNLLASKTALDTATKNLLDSINTAISDGKTTAIEKADVDAKFVLYNTASGVFSTRVEEANKAIQDKLKTFSDEASLAATEAATAAANAQTSANEAKTSVTTLNTYIDGAFKDGVIDNAEAAAIEKYINSVNNTKQSVKATFDKLYSNTFLTGAAKTDLNTKYISLNTSIDNLIKSIDAAILDGKTTDEEKNDVDSKYALFNIDHALFNTAIEAANRSIQDILKGYSDAALNAANKAQGDVDSAINSIKDVDNKVNDLNTYVDGAFKDGIISESEAVAIEKYVNSVNNTKGEVKATFEKLYANTFLAGVAKTNLNTKYIELNKSIDNLILSIDTAISDGKTTSEEKEDVDAKFLLFNTAYANFSTAIEVANISIQEKLKTYSDEALVAAQNAQTDATNAKNGVNTVNEKVNTLNTYVDGAFKDGIIDFTEAKSIHKYINSINQSKKENDAIFAKLYANPYLDGTPKTGLNFSKTELDTSIDNLISAINEAIKDDKATEEEKANVDAKFSIYGTNLAAFNTAIETANEAIQNKLKDYSDAAQDAADAAQSSANAAQSSANEANALLLDIASDSKLTPSEKQQTKKEWDIIVSEKPMNIASGINYGLSTASYTLVFNTLNVYITPLLKSLSTTSTIVGATFRDTFKRYYDERTTLLNNIARKAKELADAAQDSADQALKDIAGYSYIANALKQPPTTIKGGLVLSSLVSLGYKPSTTDAFKVMSGINGIYDATKPGNGISYWSGGEMKDLAEDYPLPWIPNNPPKPADPSKYAQSVIRMDGTVYFAGGNMWIDKDGKIHCDPLSFFVGKDQVGEILTLFTPVTTGAGTTKNVVGIRQNYPFEDGEGIGRLLIGKHVLLEDENGVLKLEKVDGTAASFYTTGGLSAKGLAQGSGGGGTGGLIQSVYGYNDLGGVFSNTDLNDTFNAYTINTLASRLKVVESGAAVSITTSGTGSLVKDVTKSGTVITITKGESSFTSLTGKPTTIAGYGITDAVLSTDARLTDSRNAKDVYAWAKASVKPSYSWTEIGSKPSWIGSSKPTYTYVEVGTKTYTNDENVNYIGVRTPTRTAKQYYEFWDSIGWANIMAGAFIKDGGTSSQHLTADGGVATFSWTAQAGQPTWLWGGNTKGTYYVYDPSNFRVANANTVGDIGINRIIYGTTETATNDWLTNSADIRKSGFYRSNADNAGFLLLIHSSHASSNYAFQIGTDYEDGSFLGRHLTNGVWGKTKTFLDNTNYENIVANTFVKKAGDTMTGSLTTPNLVISNTEPVKHIEFKRGGFNYITTPLNGSIAFITHGKNISGDTPDLIVSNGAVRPGTTKYTNLGTDTYRWAGVYANGGNFSTNVHAGTYIKAGTIITAKDAITTNSGWFINDILSRGLYNEAGNARWVYNGTTWYADKPITSTGTITGTQLVSNIASGTAPLKVASNTVVKNLNADLLDGYNRHDMFSSVSNMYEVWGQKHDIEVEGDKDTYYPVVIDISSSKVWANRISIYKNLGTKTAVYPGNHSNGTSSMWAMYEGRKTTWDGNNGFLVNKFIKMEYADLVAHTRTADNGKGALVIWLRGGGTTYVINTDYKSDVSVYYSSTNLGDSTYPNMVEPMTTIGNKGVFNTVSYNYNIESATKLNTVRTLWGQNFDGTRNVSGALSGVTRIASTAASIEIMYNNDATKAVVLNSESFKPFADANRKLLLGTQTARWSAVFAFDGNFTGALYANSLESSTSVKANNGYLISTLSGKTISIGSSNAHWCHYDTTAGSHYFSQMVTVNGALNPYVNTYNLGNSSRRWNLYATNGNFSGNIMTSTSDGAYIRVGNILLQYDSTNNAIKVVKSDGTSANLYATGGLSAKGLAAGSGGGGGGASALYQLLDVIPNSGGTGVEGALDKTVLTYDATAGKWKAAQGLDKAALLEYLTTNKYATQAWVESKKYITLSSITWSNVANKPTWIGATKPSYTYTEVGAEKAFTKNTAFNKNFGTVVGTVAQGNDSRIVNGNTAYGWGNHANAGYAKANLIGAVNGIAPLDANKLIPSSYLPSYVDDVIEVANFAALPTKGEGGKIYVTLNTNITYRWSGTAYVEISKSIGLGEIASTAYAGNKGKANADAITALRAITITAGTGLTGGGNLTANRTLSLDTSGVTAGTFTKVTVDVYGRVTKGTTLIETDIPALSIAKTTGLKTALDSKALNTISISAGSGLTGGGTLAANRTINVASANDGIAVNTDNIQLMTVNLLTSTSTTKPLSAAQGKFIWDHLSDLFEKVNVGTASAPVWAIKAKYGLYTDQFLSSKGLASGSGGGGGGGLIQSVFGYSDLGKTYLDTDLYNTFNAFTINSLANRIGSLEGGSATSVTTTGSGNAITSISKSGTVLTATKGTTFLTSHQSLANYVTMNGNQAITGRKIFSKTSSQTNPSLQPISINGINNIDGNGYLPAIGFHIPTVNYSSLVYKRNGVFAFLDYTMKKSVAVEASSFLRTGGTASQFLKADGSVDSNTYITIASVTWGNVSGKPTTFTPSAHNQTIATITDVVAAWRTMLKAAPAAYNTRWAAWSEITSKPTTILGYGITDAYTKVQTDTNISNYAPSKTGSGASGTWAISISGTAANASKVANTLSFVSGAFAAKSFNGSAAVTINVPTNTSHLANNSGFITASASISGNASTATNIFNKGTVTLASATDSNAITITAPTYGLNKPVKLLNFNWYSDTWSIGNIRSASEGSQGLGIFNKNIEIGRFTTSGWIGRAGSLIVHDIRGVLTKPTDSTSKSVFTWFSNNGTPTSEWWSGIRVTGWTNSYESWEIAGPSAANDTRRSLRYRSGLGTTWGDWDIILSTYNFNVYVPKNNGTGASGTWGISVTGNSSTASKWATARTISLTGAVTGSVSIDGSGNVSLATTYQAANITNLDERYVNISGDTMTGVLTIPGINVNQKLNIRTDGKVTPLSTSTRSSGMYGVYDSYKIAHIWSMGESYTIPDSGANFGTLYGFAYKHTNNVTGGTMAGGHQVVWCNSGVPKAALGSNGVWSSGAFITGSSSYGNGYIELSGATPSINFHHSSIADTTHRITAATSTRLDISSDLKINGKIIADKEITSAGDITCNGFMFCSKDLNVEGDSSLRGGLTVSAMSDFIDGLYVGANLDVGGNLNTTGIINSSTRIECDGSALNTALKNSGCIISGNPNGWNIGIDHNDIQARNNGSMVDIYINDYGGGVSIGATSASFYTKIKSTKASSRYTDGALVVSGGIGVSGSINTRDHVVANGAITAKATSTSDIRLKKNIQKFSGTEILKEIGMPFIFEWNDTAMDLNYNLDNKYDNFGVSAQNVQKILPGFTFECYEGGYLGVIYEKFTPILIAAQLETIGEVEMLKREVEKLKKEIETLKGGN